MGNQIFLFFPFWAFLAHQQSITLLFEKSQPFLLFEILISCLFHILKEKNYQKKCLIYLEGT